MEDGLDDNLRMGKIRRPSALLAPAHRERPVMMKQHDPGPILPNALAHETVEAVRRALVHHVRSPDAEPTGALRDALHDLAHAARERSVSPEELLVALKAIWRSLPEMENARDRDEQTRILQRGVSICIKEYFAT